MLSHWSSGPELISGDAAHWHLGAAVATRCPCHATPAVNTDINQARWQPGNEQSERPPTQSLRQSRRILRTPSPSTLPASRRRRAAERVRGRLACRRHALEMMSDTFPTRRRNLCIGKMSRLFVLPRNFKPVYFGEVGLSEIIKVVLAW